MFQICSTKHASHHRIDRGSLIIVKNPLLARYNEINRHVRVHPDLPVSRSLFGIERAAANQGRPARHPGTATGIVPRPRSHRSQGDRLLAERVVQWHPPRERRRESQEDHALLPHREPALLCGSKVG